VTPISSHPHFATTFFHLMTKFYYTRKVLRIPTASGARFTPDTVQIGRTLSCWACWRRWALHAGKKPRRMDARQASGASIRSSGPHHEPLVADGPRSRVRALGTRDKRDGRGQRGLPSPSVPYVTCHLPSKSRNDPAALALAAVRAGHRRPGPIARAVGLGVTRTYQTIDALLAAGRIAQEAN
jgi:hypothetical protein